MTTEKCSAFTRSAGQAFYYCYEFVCLHGFRDVRIVAGHDCADSILNLGIACQRDGWYVSLLLLLLISHLPYQLVPVGVWHANITY